MIGLDTNVLVRFLVQDDKQQGRAAASLIGTCTIDNPGYVAREVMVELVWVLERGYKLSVDAIATVLEGLLGAAELVIEAADRVARAVHAYREEGFGFADLMIVYAGQSAECQETYTFDRKATKIPGVKPVP